MSSCKKTYKTIEKCSIDIPRAVCPVNSPRYIFFDKLNYKKTSSSFPVYQITMPKIMGGMTVEAALAMPIFLFFIANILSLFLMYEQYSKNLAGIHQNGKNLAMVAHSAGDTSGNLVYLIKEQSIRPIIKEIGFNNASTAAIVYVRKWTGYDVMSTDKTEVEEEYVYITECGTVYHRSRDCSHLRISVSICNASDVSMKRNDYGQKYRPCERCASGNSTGLVFITDKGDKYHNSANCSGLKRTIKTVKLSETGGRGPCSLCGGK